MYFDIPLFELPSLAGRISVTFWFWVFSMFVQEVAERNYVTQEGEEKKCISMFDWPCDAQCIRTFFTV